MLWPSLGTSDIQKFETCSALLIGAIEALTWQAIVSLGPNRAGLE